MDDQFIFNTFFIYPSDVFVRFVLTLAPLNNALRNSAPRCSPEYISMFTTERQLIEYSLSFNGRFLFYHLVGAACGCRFCEIVSQFPTRLPCASCFQCRLRRWSYHCSCSSRQSRIPADSFNMPPLSIVSVNGVYVVVCVSNDNSSMLFDALNRFIPSDNHQTELLIELLALLPMIGLSPPVLNRHFTRHISNS